MLHCISPIDLKFIDKFLEVINIHFINNAMMNFQILNAELFVLD